MTTALGFGDDLLRGLEAEGYLLADQQVTGPTWDRVAAYLLQPTTDADGVIVGDKVPRLLIYRHVKGERARLIFEDEGSDEILQFAGLGYRWEEPLGWRDINGDGLLELPIWAANGGYCWACTRIYILQLQPGAETTAGSDSSRDALQVQEITGAVPFLNLLTTPLIPKWLNDLDGDGQPEIELLDGYFEFGFGLDRASSPALYRVHDWDGSRYVDVSWRFPSYFEFQIERARAAVEATYGQPLQGPIEIGQSVLVLLAYAARGQRDEGWQVFEQLSDPARWPGEAVEGATAWLTAVRDHLRSQYELGEAFRPWPPSPPPLPAPTPEESTTPSGNAG